VEGDKPMSFQKCPICNGTGNDPFIVTGSFTSYPCPTCKGVRIIDDVTGLPPVIEEKHNIFEPVEPCNADIQNAFVCNPEYRKADLKATSDAFTVYAKTIPTQTPTQDE
jgi:hypothetical protein